MKKELRGGDVWFIAETDEERTRLTNISNLLAVNKVNYQIIYNGEPGQENPIVEELSY